MPTEDMTIEQLESHMATVAATLEAKRHERLERAVATIQALAKETGLDVTIENMPPPAKAPKAAAKASESSPLKGAKVPPKFRCPETGKTWTGRGMKPNWMNGADPEQFRI